MITRATQRKTRYRGVMAVEAALLFPILMMLTLGVIEYGWLFLKANQITNAARQASRIAIRAAPTMTNADVTGLVDDLMAKAGITGHTTTISTVDVSSVAAGTAIEVKITVPWAGIALINIPYVPTPTNLVAAVSMAKEG